MTNEKELLQLARLALSGNRKDVQLYVRRLARKLKDNSPDLAKELGVLLAAAPSPASPFRKEGADPLPIDSDSRLRLARHEHPVVLEVEPILSKTLRSELEQVLMERGRMKELLSAGIAPTKSIVFTGPPGVGKTLAARWLAREMDLPLLVLDLSAVMSSYLGRTGINVRHVLDYAKNLECVLLLDEFDAIAKRRDDDTEIGELKRLVTVLLQEIEDWPETGVLIAATNHANLLDPAVWRRFDLHIDFDLPVSNELLESVDRFFGEFVEPEPDLKPILAAVLGGCSFSDIARTSARLRREALLSDRPPLDLLTELIADRLKGFPKDQKIRVATLLEQFGVSQRKASEIAGISRNTLRKYAGAMS